MDAADRRHLLLRSGIGAAPADLSTLEGMSREEGVEHIVAGLRTEPSAPMPAWTSAPPPHYHARVDATPRERRRFDRARDRELGELRLWWTREMLDTPSPQTERLVLFWHDLFATNYHGTGRGSLAMARQNATFRRLSTGTWKALLGAMIRDAALLAFLDNDVNRVASPNENMAREFLELFTLGEGHYTQSDVREAARALTGYASSETAELRFRLRVWDHDADDKTLFGVRGPHDGDALVDLVLAQPSAARHLATRFWQAFIADGPPDPDWLDGASERFRTSGHDIAVLYRHTLASDAFWAVEHRGAIVKSPVDLAIGTARSLDYPKARWQNLPRWQADLGMDLFAPPDVAGWREGDAFLTSGALLERERMMARLVAPPSADSAASPSMDGGAMDVDEGMAGMAGLAGMGGTNGMDVASFQLRLAAEHYRGSAAWQVSLFADGERVWRDLVRVLDHGHDTERDGILGGGADMPWRDVTLAVPTEVLSRADAVGVAFLNDAAGSEGDRNLYVDGAWVEGQWLDASLGVQSGDCVPDDPLAAGSLYCGGQVVMERPTRSEDGTGAPSGDLPDWRAAAVHVRWANQNSVDGRHVARLALDDLTTPYGDFHRVQFRLVAPRDGPVELEIDAYDCVPDCLQEWPDCAWGDARFPPGRLVSFPLDGDVQAARAPCHLRTVDEPTRALVAALARSTPRLLAEVSSRPSAEAHRAVLDTIAARVDGQAAGWTIGQDDGKVIVDEAFAAAEAAPARIAPPAVIARTPERLGQALNGMNLRPVDVLLAGFPDAVLGPLHAPSDASTLTAIQRIVAHPAFQLR